jgi:hypothetical protein
MASKFDKALPGFNTNLKHGGKIYHIQTEDSGKSHPHIITHVFVDGNIIASKKDSYGDHLGSPDIDVIVRDMMKKQHKEIARGEIDGTRGFSVEVEVMPPSQEAPMAEPLEAEKPEPPVQEPPARKGGRPRRPSGMYKKIYRSEPTPIPFVPSKAERERMARVEREAMARRRARKKVYMAGHEVSSKEMESRKGGKSKPDKSLEEIIADYLSEKLIDE